MKAVRNRCGTRECLCLLSGFLEDQEQGDTVSAGEKMSPLPRTGERKSEDTPPPAVESQHRNPAFPISFGSGLPRGDCSGVCGPPSESVGSRRCLLPQTLFSGLVSPSGCRLSLSSDFKELNCFHMSGMRMGFVPFGNLS